MTPTSPAAPRPDAAASPAASTAWPREQWPLVAPRVLATDLDGTLLGPGGVLSERTARALRAAADAGIEVVFVTARPPRWLAGLAGHVAGHGVAICANGAAVLSVADGRMLADHGMPRALVESLAARIRGAWGPGATFAAESASGFASEHGFRDEHEVPDGTPFAARVEDVLTDSTLKLLVRSASARGAAFSRDLQAVVGDDALVSDSGAVELGEIAAPGVTKASTLRTWTHARGIAPDEVWACGDAPNDLPMLTWAGASFAVANAFDEVRAAASHGCASNADDGVAAVLEHAATLAASR